MLVAFRIEKSCVEVHNLQELVSHWDTLNMMACQMCGRIKKLAVGVCQAPHL